MMHADRPIVIVGNWKMYKTIEETVAFIKELIPKIKNSAPKVYLAVPFTAIQAASEAVKGSVIVVGAQNMNSVSEGAFTGEIAGKMLKEAGAQFVIVGHSERRRLFHETNEEINKKVHRALKDQLQPILCIGETAEERKEGQTEQVLQLQLTKCLADITSDQLHQLMIAYEPIWAIGTGETATPEQAEEVHAFCRKLVAEHWSQADADQLVIQYGGSVNPENASQLLHQPDIDGLLVGGASLSAESFSQIVNFQIG